MISLIDLSFKPNPINCVLKTPLLCFHHSIKPKMAMFRALLSLTVTAILVKLAIGTNHTVGGASGWDLSSNFQTWAAGEKFHVGDNLIFNYLPPHNVLEVTKADFDSCQATSALKVYTDLNTVITLTSPGNRYFLCGFPEHCGQGMSLMVQTLATSAATPPSPTTTTTPPPTLPNIAAPPLPNLPIPPSPAISKPPSTLPKITIPPLPSAPPLPSLGPVPSVFSQLPPLPSPGMASSGSDSSTSPPPSPSSANRGHLLSKFITGMWFGMSMLLAL
ncbi:uclacyanin 1-like [Telopea speciosissima]|uniref:uclacyanin 1-like n=1 Tax=Telopea speciosissima TaxID=54955 RepID=UPI001CC57D49|nr:uclacyanin 1-like [Telopea speciosissima]